MTQISKEDQAGAQALIAAVGAKRAGIKRRNKIKIPRQNDNPWDGRDGLVDIQPPLIAECLIELSAGSPQALDFLVLRASKSNARANAHRGSVASSRDVSYQ